MKLSLLATNNTDRTITVLVDGVKYEYWFGDDYESVLAKARKFQLKQAYGRSINLLKTRATRYSNLT